MKKVLFIFCAAAMAFGCSSDAADEMAPAAVNNTKAPTGLADFKIPQSVNEGSYMTVVNQSKNGKSYLWDFGDGQVSNEKEPQHLYPGCGVYTLKLTVTDGNGNKTSFMQDVPVLCTIVGHHSNPNQTSGS